MRSQNGFDVLETNRTTGSLPRLRKWVIPGANRHVYLRDGSVGFLLVHFALWWHESLHRLDGGVWDEWGWAVRPVRGQSSGYSNHASGSAVDLDATQHPRGVPILRGFKPFQVAKIHTRLRLYRGALRWGGDYRSTVDGMHTELNVGLPGAEAQALRLLNTPRGRKILAANPGARDVIVAGTPLEHKPAPKPKPTPTPAPAKVRARITTANIASTLGPAAIKADYTAALAGTDILCTQENQIRRANQFVPAGWGTFQGAGGVQGRCAIHWRESVWALASARLLELNAANGLTFPGAHRVGAVVVLSHRATGKQIKVTNAHLVPHADEDTKPGVLTSFPRGGKAVIPAIESLVADAAKNPAPVQVIVGDVNVDLDSDLAIKDAGMVERFAAAGFVTDVAQLGATPDTHGTQEYDWLLQRGAKWVAHETRPKGRSDHRAKTATVEF